MINNVHHKKRKIRQNKAKDKLINKLKQIKLEIDLHSFQYYELIIKLEQYQQELEELIETQPDLATASFQQKIGYFFILGIPICAYFFNVLLIFRPAEYLIEQSLGESVIGKIATLLVPIIFVAFELGLATIIYLVQDHNKLLSARLTEVVVLITPCLLLATNVAKYSVQGRMPQLYEIILLIALFILAYITDVVIVKAIRPINQAISFIWFSTKSVFLKKKIHSTDKLCSDKFLKTGQTFDSYLQTLDKYNQAFPESSIKPPLFSDISQKFIANWLSNASYSKPV